MKIKFNPNTMLPYEIIKGSAKQRNKLAEHYTECFADKLTEKLIQKGKMGFIQPEEVRQIIDEVLPTKINYGLETKMGENAYLANYLNKDNELLLKEHKLVLPLLFSDWSGVIVHEIRHFMDAITQPALSIKRIHVPLKKMNEINEMYHNVLYTKDKFSQFKKFKLKNFLKKFEPEDKISILNYFRANMETERNAYAQCSHYANTKAKANFDYVIQNSPNEYKFDKKIKYIENILKRTIKKERKKLSIKRYFQDNL